MGTDPASNLREVEGMAKRVALPPWVVAAPGGTDRLAELTRTQPGAWAAVELRS